MSGRVWSIVLPSTVVLPSGGTAAPAAAAAVVATVFALRTPPIATPTTLRRDVLELKPAVRARAIHQGCGRAASGAGDILALSFPRADRCHALSIEHRGPFAVQELRYGRNISLLNQEVRLGASPPARRGRRGDCRNPGRETLVPDLFDIRQCAREAGDDRLALEGLLAIIGCHACVIWHSYVDTTSVWLRTNEASRGGQAGGIGVWRGPVARLTPKLNHSRADGICGRHRASHAAPARDEEGLLPPLRGE